MLCEKSQRHLLKIKNMADAIEKNSDVKKLTSFVREEIEPEKRVVVK